MVPFCKFPYNYTGSDRVMFQDSPLFCSFCNSVPSSTILFSQPLISVHRCPRPKMSRLSNTHECTCQIKSVILAIDTISLIWSNRNLHRFILRGMVDPTSLIWNVSTQSRIFLHHKALVWGVSVSLSCLFVHEPPYQTTPVCCIPVFRCCLSHMDHPTIFTQVST